MDGQNIFYHYTSINSLYNIIMSRELWLTNLKSSNDKSERYYTVNHMLKDMDEIINNSTDDNFKQYLSLLKKSFETHMPDLKNYLKKSDGYSLSLTDKKDNLSHWERYASSYSGVCIGINMDKLNVNFKDYSHFSITELEKILYSDAEILDKLSHICACFYDLFEEQLRNYNDPFQKYIEQYGFIVLVIAYNKVMNFAKNNYFADEHEFRLLFYPKTLSMKKDFLSMSRNIILPATLKPLHDKFHSLLRMSSIEQTHFSLFKNEIRSYHKLCLADIWDSELIPEITLGAMCRQNKQELNHFLKANGLKKTKITISKIPIR